MLTHINTLVITGIEASPVIVEVDIQNGLPNFDNVGSKTVINIKLCIACNYPIFNNNNK